MKSGFYRSTVGFFTLRDGDEHEFGIPAEFDSTWGNFAIIIKKDILLHLLGKGHTKIEFSDAGTRTTVRPAS